MKSVKRKLYTFLAVTLVMGGIALMPEINSNMAFTPSEISVNALDISNLVTTGNYKGFDYMITYEGTILTGYTGGLADVVVPETIITYTRDEFPVPVELSVTGLNKTFYENKTVKSVTIPEGVRSLGDSTFYSCTNLTRISLPESLKSMGTWTFNDCGITSINIPANLILERGSFRSCPDLKTVTFTEGRKSLNSDGVFEYAYATSIVLPKSLEVIPAYSFYCLENLTEIKIPENVTTIGEGAFYNSELLESISLPEKVTAIADNTFYRCTALKTVEFGKAVKSIGKSAFSESGVETVTVRNDNPTAPYSLEEIKNSAFTACYSLTSISPAEATNSLKTVGEGAFFNCKQLKTFNFGNKLVSISQDAFNNCQSLESAVLPDTLETMGIRAFDSNLELKTLKLGKCLKNIPEDAFRNCSSLTDITFSEGLETIGENAFYLCYALKSLKFPDTLKTIGNSAFYHAHVLRSITFGNSLEEIGNDAFNESPVLSGKITLPDTIRKIGNSAFYNCPNITGVNFPDGLQSIGYWAFAVCKSLRSAILPDTLTEIGESAFSGCTSMTSARIPEGLEVIPSEMFKSTNLKSIDIPNSVVEIGNRAFAYCQQLTEINFGKNLKNIDDYAFRLCTALQNVNFPDGLEKIGEYAFSGDSDYTMSLTSICLPSSLTELGRCSFCYNEKLTYAEIPGSINEIPGLVFSNCTSLKTLKLGNGIKSIGEYAFSYTNIGFIDIPDSVTSIGNYAFMLTDGTYYIRLGKGVETIGESAFLLASNGLPSIYIPETVKSIGSYGLGYWTLRDSGLSPVSVGNFTVYGISGSYAETYAKHESFNFSNKTAKLAGDLNGDGSINTSDVALMNRLLHGVSAPPASENADMNNDNVFNVFDVALAKKKSLGK